MQLLAEQAGSESDDARNYIKNFENLKNKWLARQRPLPRTPFPQAFSVIQESASCRIITPADNEVVNHRPPHFTTGTLGKVGLNVAPDCLVKELKSSGLIEGEKQGQLKKPPVSICKSLSDYEKELKDMSDLLARARHTYTGFAEAANYSLDQIKQDQEKIQTKISWTRFAANVGAAVNIFQKMIFKARECAALIDAGVAGAQASWDKAKAAIKIDDPKDMLKKLKEASGESGAAAVA